MALTSHDIKTRYRLFRQAGYSVVDAQSKAETATLQECTTVYDALRAAREEAESKIVKIPATHYGFLAKRDQAAKN